MTRKRMDNLYEKLETIGLKFEENEARSWDKFYRGKGELCTNGFLHNVDGTPLRGVQVDDVLAIAKKKKTFFAYAGQQGIKNGGVNGCFLQRGVFDAARTAIPLVTRSLRSNFSFAYAQEMDEVMKIDTALRELREELEYFCDVGHYSELLSEASARLRKAVMDQGRILGHENTICDYMGNPTECAQAEDLCHALFRLELIQ